MDNKSCIAFVIVVSLLFAAAAGVICSRNHPAFQDPHLSKAHEIGFSNDNNITITQDDDDGDYHVGRIDGSERCSDTININQGPTDPLPSGIPTYMVVIANTCMTDCMVSELHLSCGWFSSARLINPNIFRRISYDDCLVNNGNPIPAGHVIAFQYANTFPYPMSVSSLQCSNLLV